MGRRLIAVAGLAAAVGCAVVRTEEEPETTGGEESARMRYEQRVGRDGTIPPNALWRAKLRRDEMAAAHGGSTGSDTTWAWIGPGNVGGRLRSILINPTDPNTMYVGAAGGGVWKTTNAGTSWAALPNFVPSLAIGCMIFDPSDPQTLYVGTGEGVFDAPEGTSNSSNVRGAGIFKSTDAGQTWTQLPATADANWYFVNRLGFQPGSNQVLLAATATGLWRSTDAGQTWDQRTTDRTLDLEWDPTNNGRAVAGGQHGVVRYSLDGGVTWTAATGIPATSERIELTYAPSNTSIVYAGVAAGEGTTTMSVYRSTDAGQSYTLMTTSPAGGVSQLSSYTGVLWVDPNNPANLILGTQGLYRSTNSGATLTGILGSIHADNHYIAQHPQYNGSTNKTLFFATDGGIYRTSDWTVTSPASTNLNNNMGCTQFYGAAINDASGVVVAGAQDNGTNRYAGNPQSWTKNVIGGDGGYCASDPTDPNFFYGESQRLAISRSSNAGATFSVSVGGTPAIPDALSLSCNFIPYFMLDPNNPARMLACGRSLWRTNNVKTGSPPTWTAIKPPLAFLPDPPVKPPTDHYSPNDPRNISTCAIAEGNSDLIWVGHNNGQVYMSTNGTVATPSWTRVDTNAPAWPGRWVSRIVIDRHNTGRVYVSMLGYASDNVWRTTDGGLTWQSVSGSGAGALPAIPVDSLAQHRVTGTSLFAGTDIGIFESDNDGGSWYPVAPEVGPVEIQELDWRNDNALMAVTFGRGVYLGAITLPPPCYANCDGSTTPPVLHVHDLPFFLNRFPAGSRSPKPDGSTMPPVLNVLDFSCFLNAFAAGCS